jgi:hypothetical protein
VRCYLLMPDLVVQLFRKAMVYQSANNVQSYRQLHRIHNIQGWYGQRADIEEDIGDLEVEKTRPFPLPDYMEKMAWNPMPQVINKGLQRFDQALHLPTTVVVSVALCRCYQD